MRQTNILLKRLRLLIVLIMGFVPAMQGGVQSKFYSPKDRPEVEPYKQFHFTNIGAEGMSSGSTYQSAAVTGVYSVRSTMQMNTRTITGRMVMLGAANENSEEGSWDDWFDEEDDQKDKEDIRPGDPLPLPMGWDVVILLVGMAVFYQYRNKQTHKHKQRV